MLTDKELLLIAEFVNLHRLKISNIDEDIKTIIGKITSKNSLFNEISQSSNLDRVCLQDISPVKNIIIYAFCEDNNKYIVFKDRENDESSFGLTDSIIESIEKQSYNKKCIILGLKSLLVPHVAEKIGMKAIVFGTIFNKILYKNLTNYIGENEPTGEISENIIFVKQNLINESKTNESYYLSYQFDDDGKVVVGNQSKYSKFTTWFYNSIENIEKDIWKLFFENQGKDDDFIENNIYSVFVSGYKLNNDSAKDSIKKVIKRIELKLDKNRENIKNEFDKRIIRGENVDFNKEVSSIAEDTATKAGELIKSTYTSVETIIMGVSVITLGKEKLDGEEIMEDFHKIIDKVLDLEIQNINSDLDEMANDYINIITGPTEF